MRARVPSLWDARSAAHCLPRAHLLLLLLLSFDVWLGNNRGNKYSGKHMKLTRNDDEFWNFSLDDFARKDVPAMVDVRACCCTRTMLAHPPRPPSHHTVHPAPNRR